MSLKINPNQVGLGSLLKEGVKHYQGVDETVLRNIAACKSLMEITASSFGPNGLNKLVINNLDKLFLTNDAGTIMKEIEVQHPAARLILLAAQQQERIMGDGTNLVVLMAGELLSQAEGLVRMGIKPTIIAEGYEMAWKRIPSLLESLALPSFSLKSTEVRADPTRLKSILMSVLGAKQNGWESTLSTLVIEALRIAYPTDDNPDGMTTSPFNPDNVRCVKILGASLPLSQVVPGLVMEREPLGQVKLVNDAKVAIFACPLNISRTETKGTILFRGAQDMLNFSKGEERILQEQIAAIAGAGVKVVVTGDTIGELAMHFIEAHGMMALKVPSKFELKRLAKAVGAIPLARLGAPLEEEMGWAAKVQVQEIGGTKCTVFSQTATTLHRSRLATIVLRGNTPAGLDDVERAIEDALNTIRVITSRDGRMVAGGGASEIELARQLTSYGDCTSGLIQHAIKKYGEALEIIPRTLATAVGRDGTETIAKLYWAHGQGALTVGVNDELEEYEVNNKKELNQANSAILPKVVDLLAVKESALYVATEAVFTILRVDQIIESKPAGGPKPRPPGPMDSADD